MVIQRKVTKKKIPKASAGSGAVSAAPKSAPQEKGLAANPVPAAVAADFVLGTDMVISNIQEWREKMLAAISGVEEIVLDGGGVEHIDCTGLQLLVALMREATANKAKVSWKSASEVLRDNAAQIGLTGILSLDKLPEAG